MKKIAIIGATGFAAERMIPELQHSDICEVTAVYGREKEKVVNFAEKHSIKNVFTDIQQMLTSDTYDACYIATPPFLHAEHISEVSSYQIPILCEKPMVYTSEEASSVKEILADHSSIFMIGHHIRHQKAIVDLKKILKDNKIGDVVSVDAQWSYTLDPTASYASWKLDQKLGGISAMNDAGIHIIDLVHCLFGNPDDVKAQGISAKFASTIDTVSALLRYKHMVVDIRVSQAVSAPKNDLIIYGTSGRIEVSDAFSQEYIKEIIIIDLNGQKSTITYSQTYLYKNEMENLLGLAQEGVKGTSLEESVEQTNILEKINQDLIHAN